MIELPKLVLASGSPRRAEILRSIGWEFEKDVPDIDERELPGESPEAYVQRLAAEKAAAEKAAAEAKAQAAATRVASAPSSGEALFTQAASLEQEGKGRDAVKMYTQAARSGNGKAAKRLGEIFDKGLVGIQRDYAESLKWYNAARVLGEDVPMAKSR